MWSLGPEIIGCVSPDGFRQSRGQSFDRLPALRGRPRYRLKDTLPSSTADLTLDLSGEQFAQFQTFWNGPARQGAAPFTMRLLLNVVVQDTPVRAKAPWTATQTDWDRWQVNLTVEVAADDIPLATFCPVLYGGPLDDLADVDIYGGPLSALAMDVVNSCDRIF